MARRVGARRALKILVGVTLGVLAVAVLVLGATFALARTSWGAERIRRFAVARANAVLAGHIEVGAFHLSGSRMVLDQVSLLEPNGAAVARIARVDLTFSLRALLRRHLELRSLTIDAPGLWLRQGTGGTNLARALSPRTPAAAAPPPSHPAPEDSSSGKGFTVVLGDLVVRDGVIEVSDLRPHTGPPPPLAHVRLNDVNVKGSGKFVSDTRDFAVRLDGGGEATLPWREAVSLRIDGKGRLGVARGGTSSSANRAAPASQTHGNIEIELGIGDSTLHCATELESTGAAPSDPESAPPLRATVVAKLRVMPALVRWAVPESRLLAPVGLSGRATWAGDVHKLSLDLDIEAGGAAALVKGTVDLTGPAIDGLSVRARAIDLSRLVTDGPPSRLSFDLDAHGSGQSLETLRGALTLNVPPGRLGGYALGPIRLRADADRGRYKVMDVLAVLPGAKVSGAGEATARTVAFRGAIDLRDLGATVRSLDPGKKRSAARRPAPVAGKGRLDLVASGNLLAPALQVRGHLSGLVFGDIRVPKLRLSADVPNLRAPLAATANLDVPDAVLGGRRFRGFLLSLRSAGPRFEARVSLASPEKVRLEIGGDWRAKRTELALERLTLTMPAATWALTQPMRLTFGDGVIRVSGMDWSDGGAGRLRLGFERSPRELRADVALAAFDIKKLPPSLLPTRLRLGGVLGAELHVAGHPDRPRVEAKIHFTNGEVGTLRDISIDGDARLADGRASGRLALGALGARVAGPFDLPLAWPPPVASPLALDLEISNLDLSRLPAALRDAVVPQAQANPPPGTAVVVPPGGSARARPAVAGIVSGHLTIGGSGARPRLSTNLTVRQLAVNGIIAPDVKLSVDGDGPEPVNARLELLPAAGALGARKVEIGGPSYVAVRTGLSLGALVHHRQSADSLLTTPLHVEARLDAVKLGPLAALAGYPRSPGSPDKVGGAASLTLVLDGTPSTARGHVGLDLSGVSSGQFPPTDAAVHVELGAREVRADARVTRQGVALFSLDARVAAPVARLNAPGALGDTPIEVHAVIGPLDLQRLGLPPETDRQPARILTGRLNARADITGTLHAPRISVRADATDMRLDKTAIGNGHVTVTSRDRKVSADAMLMSGNGGRLHLVASTKLDLGYPAITHGVDPRRLSLLGRIDAKGFDVSGLSGSSPGLRAVAGQLFAGVDVTGTAADPRVTGRLEWKDGELTVTGMGAYKKIHLLAHGANDHLVLDELRADSGGGWARVTGSGDHRAEGGYSIKNAMELRTFPAYVDGQALATVSMKATAETQLSVQVIRSKVSIASARLALSDAKRKHLQPLAEPGDVILVDGDSALNGAQGRKLAAVTATLVRPTEGTAASEAEARRRAAGGRLPSRVVVLVTAPRNLWVNGMDANLELGLESGFRVEVGEVTRVYGQIDVKRGRVDVVGRRFDLKADSSVRFAGPSDAPELDVSANHVNEKENITVLVNVKGTPGHLQIRITAPDRPDLTETQLYTLIVTGRLDLGGGGTPSSTTPTDRAASLAGGLVAAQLQKNLSKKLPFDVLTIEAGNGFGAARLEAGTYVTSSLYVGYVGRLGADPALLQNRNAVHLEYELGARWSFQGEYGDAKTGSADVIWTKRY